MAAWRQDTMNSVRIGKVVLRDGARPVIIIPLTASSPGELEEEAKGLADLPAEIAEWRVDLMEECWRTEAFMCKCLAMFRRRLRVPVLATLRTSWEGGNANVSSGEYVSLCGALCESTMIDALDVEAFSMGEDAAREVIRHAHACGIPVVASSHDFVSTPPKEEIVRRLRYMQDDLEADILKIAAMPQVPADVLTLLVATEEMRSRYARQPLIAISMGPLGTVSRIAGQFFGSAASFGCGNTASAPGQMDAVALRTVLGALDRAIAKK